MKNYIIEDCEIILGTTAKENWKIIENINPEYIWLHLNSFPSGHLIIKDENPSIKIIKKAAELCKNNTKFKNLKNIKIVYTKCSNIYKGNKVGEVFFKKNRQVKFVKI